MTPLHILPALTSPVGARPQRGSQTEDMATFPNLLGQVATGDRAATHSDENSAQTTKSLTKGAPSDKAEPSAALGMPAAPASASLMVLLAPLFQAQPDRPTAGAGPGTTQLPKLAANPSPVPSAGPGHVPVSGSPAETPPKQGKVPTDEARVTDLPADKRVPATGPDALPPQAAVAGPTGVAQTAPPVSQPIQQSPVPVRPAAAKQVNGVAPSSSSGRQGVSANRTESLRDGTPFDPEVAGTSETGSPKPKPADASATKVTVDQPAPGPTPSAAEQVVTALQQVGLGAAAAEPRGATAPGAGAPGSGTVRENAPAVSAQARSLKIELNPENLGPVSVTLRKTATGVDIQIAVSTPEALHALERDRHVLTAAVAAAGGSHDRLALTNLAAVHADATTPAAAPAGGQDSPSQGAAPPGTSPSGGQSRDQQRSDPSRAAQTIRDDEISTPPPIRSDRLDGSLYL